MAISGTAPSTGRCGATASSDPRGSAARPRGSFIYLNPPPRVLDATCSLKRRWPEVADVRVDISLAARPDVRANATQLPFADATFTEVYCDPPFNIYRTGTKRDLAIRAKEGDDYGRFGHYETLAEWRSFVGALGREFARVLVPHGVLHFKVSHGIREQGSQKGRLSGANVPYTDVVALPQFQLIEDLIVRARGPFAGLKGSPPRVHYLTLARRDT